MGQRAFRGDEISADALRLRNLKRDLCKRKLKVGIIISHLRIVGNEPYQTDPN